MVVFVFCFIGQSLKRYTSRLYKTVLNLILNAPYVFANATYFLNV
jgi:hypothetical protein